MRAPSASPHGPWARITAARTGILAKQQATASRVVNRAHEAGIISMWQRDGGRRSRNGDVRAYKVARADEAILFVRSTEHATGYSLGVDGSFPPSSNVSVLSLPMSSAFSLESPPPPVIICSRRRLWLASPPLRPASRASSLVHSWAVPFWCAALPPFLRSHAAWRDPSTQIAIFLGHWVLPSRPVTGFFGYAPALPPGRAEPIKCNGSATEKAGTC